MKRFMLATLIFVIMGLIGHFATLHMTPGVIMSKAMKQIEARGVALHRFSLLPRTTPKTQTVVRPSPDLAYSICRFDLSGDEVLVVRAGLYDNYTSVSFFDMHTNNFATVRVGAGDNPASGSEILLRGPGGAKLEHAAYVGPQFESPTQRGLILIRRVAPTVAAYEKVISIASDDSCALLSNPHTSGQ